MKRFISLAMPVALCAIMAASFVRSARVAAKGGRRRDAAAAEMRMKPVGETSLKDRVDGWMTMAGEKEFAALDMRLSKLLTGTLRSTQVLDGKDGWLFYKSTTDGDSMTDYIGRERFSESFMEDTLAALGELEQKLRKAGVRFCLLMAPNKESVYPEYMPDKVFRTSDKTRTDVLMRYLADRAGFPVAYPKETLLEQKRHYLLYYPMDTHWNVLGGYVGVQSVIAAMGQETVPLSTRKIAMDGPPHRNDLVKMAKASDIYNGIVPADWRIVGQPQVSKPDKSDKGFMDYRHNENASASSDKSVLVVGDSFRSALRPSLLERYRHVHDVHHYKCDSLAALLEKARPDILILESVERYAELIAPTARRLAQTL